MSHIRAISVHYAEIALKGRNRSEFEGALAANIRAALGGRARIERAESRMIVRPEGDIHDALEKLGKVFGIAWFSPSIIAGRDIEEMKRLAVSESAPMKGMGIKVEASRSDKKYPLGSPEINREIGMALEHGGHTIAMENPAQKIYVEVLRDRSVISVGRTPGLGGLPVGTSGPVLSLLSGGIDSPVASWLMLKRGCAVDFLHVHAGRDFKEAGESKMPRLVGKLREYMPGRCRMFIAPYTEFYKRSVSMDPRIELVVFRRFMLHLASRIAEQNGHVGLATGDNIGQVASQTLENLLAVNSAASLPIYRPLAAYDKQEIVSLARRIGTYGISIEEYKDCCSLVAAKHPSTRVSPGRALAAEEEAGMGAIVEKTMGQVRVLEI